MSSYLQHMKKIDAIVGLSRPITRIAAVVGDDPPPPDNKTSALVLAKPRPVNFSDFLTEVRARAPQDVRDGVGTVVGGAVGAIAWEGHRVLGLISGASIGRNVPALFRETTRTAAIYNLSTTGAGVAGSLLWQAHPVWGFLFGNLAGSVAVYFVGLRRNT